MAEVLELSGKLDVSAAAALQADLIALEGKDAVLDFTAVTQMGALCLQICLAAARAAQAAQSSFALANVPDPVLSQLTAMGFTPETLAEGRT